MKMSAGAGAGDTCVFTSERQAFAGSPMAYVTDMLVGLGSLLHSAPLSLDKIPKTPCVCFVNLRDKIMRFA